MDKTPRLRLVSSNGSSHRPPQDAKVAIIASITQIEVVVPWLLRVISWFIPNLYLITLQEFSDEYRDPLEIPHWTHQCDSIHELRTCLYMEKQRLGRRGKLTLVDYTHQLGEIVHEFNQ